MAWKAPSLFLTPPTSTWHGTVSDKLLTILTPAEIKAHTFWTKVWDEEKATIKELKSLPDGPAA